MIFHRAPETNRCFFQTLVFSTRLEINYSLEQVNHLILDYWLNLLDVNSAKSLHKVASEKLKCSTARKKFNLRSSISLLRARHCANIRKIISRFLFSRGNKSQWHLIFDVIWFVIDNQTHYVHYVIIITLCTEFKGFLQRNEMHILLYNFFNEAITMKRKRFSAIAFCSRLRTTTVCTNESWTLVPPCATSLLIPLLDHYH